MCKGRIGDVGDSIAMHLMFGWLFSDHFTANLLLHVPVNKY